MNYQKNKSYPIPKVKEKNTYYASLLLFDYAGKQSEDTAIHQYLFQSLILKKQNPELAQTLEHIAIVEMHHLNLLGETITLLGVKPIFATPTQNNKYIPWNASTVLYDTNIINILKKDIEHEQNAITLYQQHIKIIQDSNIQELLQRIIEDEQEHISIFTQYLKKLMP